MVTTLSKRKDYSINVKWEWIGGTTSNSSNSSSQQYKKGMFVFLAIYIHRYRRYWTKMCPIIFHPFNRKIMIRHTKRMKMIAAMWKIWRMRMYVNSLVDDDEKHFMFVDVWKLKTKKKKISGKRFNFYTFTVYVYVYVNESAYNIKRWSRDSVLSIVVFMIWWRVNAYSSVSFSYCIFQLPKYQ